MSTNFWSQNQDPNRYEDDSTFRDTPDQWGNAPLNIKTIQPVQQAAPVVQQAEEIHQVFESSEELTIEDTDDDFTDVLSDARLRLEQGSLYELIMNSDLFGGSESKAARNVQREIRRFAKERMEIMLGMRQEVQKVDPLSAHFSEMEIMTLKAVLRNMTQNKPAITAAPVTQMAVKPIALNPIELKSKPTLSTLAVPASTLPPKQVQVPKSAPMPSKGTPIRREAKPKAATPVTSNEEVDTTNMTLQERNALVTETQKSRKPKRPKDAKPMPSLDQRNQMATQQAAATMSASLGTHPAVRNLNMSNLMDYFKK